MKRFDRLIAILLQLQTSRLVRAADLAERFAVSERTIYRDMRSLENAGVPLIAEAGLGYYLDRQYHLPAVNFSPDEAISLLVSIKGAQAHVPGIGEIAQSAMDKLLAVMDNQQRSAIRDMQDRIAITGLSRPLSSTEDLHYGSCLQALTTRRTLRIEYLASYNGKLSDRVVEPVGLSHYGGHWHLIAWCQHREAMRDFRLDRMCALDIMSTPCPARPQSSLKNYFKSLEGTHPLRRIKIAFKSDFSKIVGMEKYRHGYLESETVDEEEIMTFLTAHPEYLGRWLLQYTDIFRVVDNPDMQAIITRLITALLPHLDAPEK